jgi:hypothetical protein
MQSPINLSNEFWDKLISYDAAIENLETRVRVHGARHICQYCNRLRNLYRKKLDLIRTEDSKRPDVRREFKKLADDRSIEDINLPA